MWWCWDMDTGNLASKCRGWTPWLFCLSSEMNPYKGAELAAIKGHMWWLGNQAKFSLGNYCWNEFSRLSGNELGINIGKTGMLTQGECAKGLKREAWEDLEEQWEVHSGCRAGSGDVGRYIWSKFQEHPSGTGCSDFILSISNLSFYQQTSA